MTTTGEVAKGILIFFCGCYLLMTLAQAVSGQLAFAAFLLAGFSIPLTYVIYGYVKDKTRKSSVQPQKDNSV
jgi:hypothetical protein